MAYARKAEGDKTIHWTDNGEVSACGQDTPLVVKGRAVTSLIDNKADTGIKACGRCTRSLQSLAGKTAEAITSMGKVA